MAIVGHFSAVILLGSGSSPALEVMAADIKSIKTDVGTIKSDISAIKSTVTSNGTKLDAVQADVTLIKEQNAPPVLE